MTKLTISLPEDLAEAVRTRAAIEGTSVSGYIAHELRRAHLVAESQAAVAEYEAEHGEITEEELERVRRWIEKGWAQWRSPSTPAT